MKTKKSNFESLNTKKSRTIKPSGTLQLVFFTKKRRQKVKRLFLITHKNIFLMIKKFGALLTDLSQAFDCTNHPLLIAKLYNYEVPHLSINIIFSYLSNRTHRTKINKYFSQRSRIEHGVSQGSYLGLLLFNIDLIHFFMNVKKTILLVMPMTLPHILAQGTPKQ